MFQLDNTSENDIYHLNVGVPLLIGFFIALINIEFFAIKFLEPLHHFFYIYLIFSVLFLVFKYLKAKWNKSKTIHLSLYDFSVFNSILVFLFLYLNISISQTVFQFSIPYDYDFRYQLNNAAIPNEYRYLFEPSESDYENYFNQNYVLNVEINRSLFNYTFIEKKAFEKP